MFLLISEHWKKKRALSEFLFPHKGREKEDTKILNQQHVDNKTNMFSSLLKIQIIFLISTSFTTAVTFYSRTQSFKFYFETEPFGISK